MRSILGHIRRSLSTRLSLWVAVIVAAIFATVYSMVFSEIREVMKEEAFSKATKTLEGTVLHIDNTLHSVEVASNNMLYNIEQHLDNPDMMFELSRQTLKDNPILTGCSISFDPFYYKSKGQYFSAYSYNDGKNILTEQEGNEEYQYHTMDWYLIPRLLDRPYWLEPYKEDASVGIVVNDIFTSYSQPIHDKRGKTVGTFSVDICLDWFSETVSAAKPYPNSYSILLGRGGTFLVHPDTTRLFYETIFTRTLEKPDSALRALGNAMLDRETGHKEMEIDGEDCYVFYKPFKNTEWSVAIICKESDIIAPYVRMKWAYLSIATIGILLLVVFSSCIVRKNLRPLRHLTKSAQRVADEHFNGDVHESHRVDEIGQLESSFKTMQQSLAGYVGEIKQQTETLEGRNRELEEAYERATQDERMKTSVVRHMTGQMAEPVSLIVKTAQVIHDEGRQMSADELRAKTREVTDNTTQVTGLLDELLKTAQEEAHTPERKEGES